MRRSWFLWITSVFAFFAIVIVVVASGPTQQSNAQGEKKSADKTELGLPNLKADDLKNNGQDTPAAIPPASNPYGQTAGASATATSTREQVNAVVGANTVDTNATASATDADGGYVPGTLYSAITQYQPPEVVQLADPSNYGERYAKDINGQPVDNDYIVVLHETVGSASSALNTFQTNHPSDDDQVSYHTLITLDGTVIYVVPPEQRAFGAGNSSFASYYEDEAVFTHPDFPSSVNNFAYHVSLETPSDGQNNSGRTHSGYTEAQYQSLAWLIARTNIPDDRITTHQSVDRSGSRMDPRSFEADRMYGLLRQYPSRQAL